MNDIATTQRRLLSQAKRIVVKVGTHGLGDATGKPNLARITNLACDLSKLQQSGREVIFVTSGAIGVGMDVLKMQRTPQTALHDLQMAAAIGQPKLMHLYQQCFSQYGNFISQILLTYDDLRHPIRSQNIRATLLNLFQHKIIPVINENDVVSVDEIRLGDNDVLSAFICGLINADLLILLTTPNGLQNSYNERVPYLNKIDENILSLAVGKKSALSSGGMETKLKAATTANQYQTKVVIASAFEEGVISKIINGEDIGTFIYQAPSPISQSSPNKIFSI